MSATSLALRHGRALLFLAVAAALAGVWAAIDMAKGVYPEVTFLREQVVASLPGAPAATVLAGLTRPLENGLSTVPGVETVRSRTIRGAAEISLFFATGTDMKEANSLVVSRIAELRSGLPAGSDVTAARVLPSGFPILSFNVEGPYPASQLYELAQYTVRPALSGLPGVGEVSVQSSDEPEFEVLLDPSRLLAAHLTVPQVADRLAKANAVSTVARIDFAHELVLGAVSGQLLSPDDVGAVVVGGTPALPLRVSDLGRVVNGVAPRTSLIRVDGGPGVIINVARRPGGDILVLDRAAKDTLARLAPSLPPGVRFVPVYEQADFVSAAVSDVGDAVLFGAIFAVIVLALFLRDARATFVAALSLPLTLGAALLVLRGLGQTLNLMTLGGLAVSVGLVIDDAVVVVEAVHRHLEAGQSPAEAARLGTEELFWPVVGPTATTLVVFLPLGLLSGVAGEFFGALSLALAAAVLISLVIALAVLPPIAAQMLRPVRRESAGHAVSARYRRLLARVIQRRWLLIGLAVLLVAGGVLAGAALSSDFLPEADEGAYVVDYYAPVAASLDDADRLAAKIEAVLRQTPEVAGFSRRLGAELGPPTATLSSRGDIAVRLKPHRDRDIDEIMDAQRDEIAQVAPGLRVEFSQVLSDMLGDMQGSPEPIELKIYGPDLDVLQKLAGEAARRIHDVPGLVDFFDGNVGCAPELDLEVDRVAAGREGLSAAEIGDQLAGAELGEVATQLRRPDHLEDIRVRMDLPKDPPTGRAALEQVPLLDAAGKAVPVSSLGAFRQSCPASEQLRENGRNLVHLTARLSGTSLGEAAAAVRARLADWRLPVGYSWELGGLIRQQRESFASLFWVLAVAIGAVMAVLLFQLRSLRRSLSVMAATPIALAAGALTLAVTSVSLNVSSMMGAIVLIGLVVKNGILLLDYAQAAEARGVAPREAVLDAAQARLRPILMTTLATLVALIPLVLGLGAGSALHRPLAIVVVGGLLLSTAGTLFLVPTLALRRQS